MNYKVFVYVIVVFLTAFSLTGVDINRFFKQGKVKEANAFVFLLILAISELVTNFIIHFLEVSKIL